MTELAKTIESIYENAKTGEWDRVRARWSEVPLLARRCSRYARATSGWTFLHQAAYFGDEAACRALIRVGAFVGARAKDGRTPQDVARQKGHAAVAALLARAWRDTDDLWRPSVDPDLRPSSNLWSEGRACIADQGMLVAYGGATVLIPRGARHFVDSFDRVLVGWHGTYDPPSGMDGESML